jgi:hypothetical protein
MAKYNTVSIYDLDGVVIDSTHRYRTINHNGNKVMDLQHWRDNEHLAHHDELLPHAERYKRDIAIKSKLVIIATAREMKQPDFNFINSQLGRPCAMVYRKIGDTRKGAALKIQGIEKVLSAARVKVDPSKMVVYEDNHNYLKDICQHFKCLGVYVPSNQGY